MTTRTTIRSGDNATLASPALLPLLIGVCTSGVPGTIYTFDPGDDVSASLGGGTGADECYALLRETQGRVRFSPAEPTWGPTPSVVHSGTGPTVTVALADDADGPFDLHKIVFTVTTGGNGGEGAAVSAAYDGSTVIETLPIPAETPAVLRGTADITNGAGIEGTHLDFTAPSSDVLTFPAGSLAGAAAGLKAATATSASPVTLTASDLLSPGKAAILANPRRLTFTTAGATPSDAPATVAITGTRMGAAVTETLSLAQTAATVTSAKDYDTITSLAYAAGDGTAATIAIGYGTGYATPAEIVTAFDTLALAAGLAVNARAAQNTAGATLLELFTTSAGSGVTQTIDDAASTADVILGFSSGASNLTATGAAATIAPPWTGLEFTFPATSEYVRGDTYTTTCQAPTASIAAIVDAATAAHDDYKNNPFGFIVVGQPSDTAANCAALESALATLQNTWIADARAPVFISFCIGSPFHVASSTLATNNANINTADAALLLAFQAASANFGNVAVEDVYLPGSTSLRFGSFRRTAALVWAAKHAAAAKIAADTADGLASEATLLAPDLLTRARDDATATTKLGGDQGPGFSALKSTSAGLGFVKFQPGATRAGPTSRLRFIGPLTVALEIARQTFPFVELWEGQTDPANPITRQMADAIKKDRQNAVYSLLKPTLLPAGAPQNVTTYTVTVSNPPTGVWLDNGITPIKISFVPLGEITEIVIDITATGAVISTPAAA